MRLLLNIINIQPGLSSLLSSLSNSVNEGKSDEWWQKINLPGQKKIKVMQWTTWKLIIVHGIPLPRLIFTFTFRHVLCLSVCFHKHSKNTPNIIKMSCFIYGNICSSCMKLWSHVSMCLDSRSLSRSLHQCSLLDNSLSGQHWSAGDQARGF